MPEPLLERPPASEARPRLRGRFHAAGSLVLLLSAPALLRPAAPGAERLAVAVYLAGVGSMLLASAIYHVPAWGPVAKQRLRRLDHSAIFLCIAGTYTPLVLVATDGWFRTGVLVTVWGGAAIGIAIRNLLLGVRPWIAAAPYVALGWVALVLLPALLALSPRITALVVAGGVVYTLGAVVYARKRPDPWPRVFGFHELFHALTLVALGLHWLAVRAALLA